ncbi:MAG: polysaccharide deacetylase family protein [Wujia sp.]
MKGIKARLIFIAVFVLLMVGILIKGGFLSDLGSRIGFINYNGNNSTASDADGQVGTDEDSTPQCVDARYLTFEIENHVRDKDTYYSYSNEKLEWWFKRDTEHGPSGCDDTIDISDYGAYYLDKNAISNGEGSAAVDEESKVLYLTFDCGYENGYTNQILDVLKQQEVPACFFVTQTFIRDNPELVIRMKEEGHQVGNHTITHPSLPSKSYEEIIEEITGCADYMKEKTGYSMDPYLRPPRGEYSERTLAITSDLGYKTIFWSMAYLDYDVNNQPGANYVIEHFNKYHHSGAIILMHNVSSSNAAALETVISNMKEQGYRFASLNELK